MTADQFIEEQIKREFGSLALELCKWRGRALFAEQLLEDREEEAEAAPTDKETE